MSHSPSSRTRTPPDIKWLLNERAALSGAVGKASIQSQALSAKMAKLQLQMDRLSRRLQASENNRLTLQKTLEAFDQTIAIAGNNVRPEAGGIVHAWAGKYGQRGAVVRFVNDTLKDASPAPMTIGALVLLAAEHFGITLGVPADRAQLRWAIKAPIRKLVDKGLIEPLHVKRHGEPGVWRWREAPALSDLRLRAMQAEHEAGGPEVKPDGRPTHQDAA